MQQNSQNNQNNNDNQKVKKFKSIITTIIAIVISILFGILIGVGISKGDDLLGFLGAILGALSAYILFKLENMSDKKKEENQEREDTEYKKQMLYTLIDHTLSSTKKQYDGLEELYAKNYKALEKYVRETNDHIINTDDDIDSDVFILSKNLSMDINDIEMLKDYEYDTPKNIAIEVYKTLNKHFKTKTLNSNSLTRGFYDKNWINYIDCVENGVERYDIINWLSMLQSLDRSIPLTDFIFYRNRMFSIIKDNYPEIKEYGVAYRIDSTKKGYSKNFYKNL